MTAKSIPVKLTDTETTYVPVEHAVKIHNAILAYWAKHRTAIENAYHNHALHSMANNECEVDSNAQVSEDDDGAFVQAWIWVDALDADVLICDECGNRNVDAKLCTECGHDLYE